MVTLPGWLDTERRGCGVLRCCTLLLVAAQVICPTIHAAPRTDIVVFQNGDRLTGEIKGLEQGQLEFKTDSAGTVYIEWDKLVSVQTSQYLEVETSRGERHFGSVPPADGVGTLGLAMGGRPAKPLAMSDVIRMRPIEQGGLLDRLDGSLAVGFNYTKANNETQFNLSGDLRSRNEVREWSLDGSSTMYTQSDGRSTSMYDVTLANRRFLRERWFLQGFGTVQGNEELGLDIREVVGGGIGRYLVQDMHSEWAAFGALAYSHEKYEEEDPRNSVEAILGTQYSFYRYDTPKRSFDAGLAVFPSLTESGRVRAEADLTSRFEIVNDLFFDLSVYGSYDTDPGETAESNSDYGVVTSLGYSF
jgi:hypothetical protein